MQRNSSPDFRNTDKKSTGEKRILKRSNDNTTKSTDRKPTIKRKFETKSGPTDRKNEYHRKEYSSKSKSEKRNEKPESELVRLNKFIATSGICSRREADEYIRTGLVKVNGVIITEMGVKINPTDEVKFNDSLIKSERKVYILLNKPKDFITTVDDPFAKRTVLDLVKNACRERIYPVGRLDRNTTGVLLLTNDGELTKKLTHPKYEKKKIYHVGLDKFITRADLEKIAEGIELEDGFIKADAISYIEDGDKKQVGIELHSGKNRIVKRIFERLGYEVVRLDRVYFAGLTKKNLPRGHWRALTEQEIGMLKMGAYQ